MKTYKFNKKVAPAKIREEIGLSTIVTALADISVAGNISKLTFKATLSSADYLTLAYLIDMHNSTTMEEEHSIEATINEIPPYARAEIDRTYLEKSLVIDVPAEAGSFEGTISFSYPIILLGGECAVRPDMVGDEVSVDVEFAAPSGNIVGQLVENSTAGENYIIVDEVSASKYIFKSFRVSLINTVLGTYEDLGECIGKEGNKILLDKPTTFDNSAGTYVCCTAVMVPYLYLSSSPYIVYIGNSTNRGTYVPPKSIIRVRYNNITGKAKKVGIILEYYV